MGKTGDLTRLSQGALPCSVPCPPPRPRSRTPQSPGAAARPPEAQWGCPVSPPLCSTPPSVPLLPVAHSGAGGGARGVRAHPAKGSYLSARVRPTKLGLLLGLQGRGGSHGRGSRLPPPRAPRPYGGPERGRRDQGTGAAPAGGGGSRGARWGGAGASAGPRPEGTWERLSGRTKAAGEGSEPPGPGPELELALDTSSGRWRGNPSELGRGLSRSPHVPGRGRARPPRRRVGAWHAQVPPGPVRPQSALDPRALASPRPPRESGCGRGPLGLRPRAVGRGPAPRPAPATPTPLWARAAAVAARGWPDSLHVASAAAIQPLIER